MKLSPATIIIIGIAFAISVISYGYFHEYVPNNTEAGYFVHQKELREAEQRKLPQAKKRLETAKAMVEERAQKWREVVQTNTPLPDVSQHGVNISVNPYQLVVDTAKFRNNIQRALNVQIRKGGVKVERAPELEPVTDSAVGILSSFYNYPAIPFPVVIFDLGQVTVSGTYKQITDNVRSYRTMPHYLIVADGLSITGTSPHLTGTYNITLVGFIRGKSVWPGAPEGAAAAGGTGGGPAAFGGGTPPGGPGGTPPGVRKKGGNASAVPGG